ncbi:MAG: polyphosphate kinase 2 [Hyphomicrobiales bacterium]|nr:MAG: polyphosphate kinase 2 [Hyphomicrobiales bacterium]
MSVADLFDIEAPELAPEIKAAAFGSGNYPYEKKLKTKRYLKQLRLLQIELIKVSNWAQDQGERIVIIFEGRDSAGKGGTIKRFTEHVNPRQTRVVALPKPNDRERGEWYFQRYVRHLPTAGEMVLFDRSWYNRAGVEPVMGFCTEAQRDDFLEEAPAFEGALVRSGIRLFKFWLTIGQEEQLRRLHARRHDPLKRWKLSPIDLKAIHKWDEYTAARQLMFEHTDRERAPWTIIRTNDKRRGRLGAMRAFLSALPYADKDEQVVAAPDPLIVGDFEA